MPSFVLASQSPRRKTLLEWAEIPFEIIVSDIDESYPSNLEIEEVPVYIAKNKALAVKEIISSTQPTSINKCIIAADTVVVLDQKIIGKPSNRAQAIESLLALSGQTHKVITGVVLLHQDKEISFSEITLVEFHALTPEQIEFYVEKYKPYDKAGGYAIQEWIGVVGIKKITGDFYNVMGLPVSKLVQKIKQLNIV
ncbi:MAG: septum formation protein Maf [Chitinophagia bacterium]|jgi:septum formation protein|nr:septum formation protein Maf [Chitinophagia bacterium]NCA30325.1 septum formation protein Maf [Chitinophagia bacterium]NDD15713.1 septum formation protein Maf [Chitinophagia bacterium]